MLPGTAQDLEGPVGLANLQGTARPGQHSRLRRDLRPFHGRVDDGVHSCQQGSAYVLRQLGQLARPADRERFREVPRAPRDALDRHIRQIRVYVFDGWSGSARIRHDDQGAYFEIELA